MNVTYDRYITPRVYRETLPGRDAFFQFGKTIIENADMLPGRSARKEVTIRTPTAHVSAGNGYIRVYKPGHYPQMIPRVEDYRRLAKRPRIPVNGNIPRIVESAGDVENMGPATPPDSPDMPLKPITLPNGNTVPRKPTTPLMTPTSTSSESLPSGSATESTSMTSDSEGNLRLNGMNVDQSNAFSQENFFQKASPQVPTNSGESSKEVVGEIQYENPAPSSNSSSLLRKGARGLANAAGSVAGAAVSAAGAVAPVVLNVAGAGLSMAASAAGSAAQSMYSNFFDNQQPSDANVDAAQESMMSEGYVGVVENGRVVGYVTDTSGTVMSPDGLSYVGNVYQGRFVPVGDYRPTSTVTTQIVPPPPQTTILRQFLMMDGNGNLFVDTIYGNGTPDFGGPSQSISPPPPRQQTPQNNAGPVQERGRSARRSGRQRTQARRFTPEHGGTWKAVQPDGTTIFYRYKTGPEIVHQE